MHMHSILIQTSAGIQPADVIDRLAAEILRDSGYAAGDPDLTLIDKHVIQIEDIRSLISWAQKLPYARNAKLAVVWGAERMTEQAQSSLLKLLEEPPASTLICVATTNPRQLLPTTVSRLRVFDLGQTATRGNDGISPDAELIGDAKLFVDSGYSGRLAVVERYVSQSGGKEESQQTRTRARLLAEQIAAELLKSSQSKPKVDAAVTAVSGLKYGASIRLTLETLAITI